MHERARAWLEAVFAGPSRVGIPWTSLSALLRISTNPRATSAPLSAGQAWETVDALLAQDVVWTPMPTKAHAEIFGDLVRRHGVTGNLVPDAELAALALQHGLTVCSADSDFARFTEVRWLDPLAV